MSSPESRGVAENASSELAAALNPRQRKFAEAVASGRPAGAAYREAGYTPKAGSSDADASRMLKNAKVAAYLESLQAEGTRHCKVTQQEVSDFLADIIMTPVGDVDRTSRLCQEYRGPTEHSGEVIKMPNKIQAVESLAKLLGWNKPDKIQHSFGGSERLRELMEEAMEPDPAGV